MKRWKIEKDTVITREERRRVADDFIGTSFVYDVKALAYRAGRLSAGDELPKLGFLVKGLELPNGTLVLPDTVEVRHAKEILAVPESASAPRLENAPALSCRNAVLMDSRGKMIISKRAHDLAYPASTTKIITALTALDNLESDDGMVIGDELDLTFEGDDPSLADCKKGEYWCFKDILYGMLLPSGNDAAYEAGFLSEKKRGTKGAPREVIDRFVMRMNEKARELGLVDSHFMVPDGNSYYDSAGNWDKRMRHHLTSAYDLARAALVLLASPLLRTIVATPKVTIKLKSGEEKHFSNTNRFLHKDRCEYDPYIIGVKTGTTNPAGPCLVACREEGGKLMIAACLNNDTGSGRYENTRALFDCYYGKKK